MMRPEFLDRHRTRIDALDAHDPGMGAQAGMQLAMAHVDADHARRTLLQEAIGEATRGLADIQATQADHLHTCGSERAFELYGVSCRVC